jgi:hypothetical protein
VVLPPLTRGAFKGGITISGDNTLQKLLGAMRKAIEDYHMIENGDRIAVGVSGGKDSLALLCALAKLKRVLGLDYTVVAVTIDMGLDGADFSKIKEYNQCCTWFYNGDNAQALVDYINEKYPDAFSGYRNGGAVDMPPAGVSKSTGILAYANMFDDVKIYTVGDNFNDLGMIQDFESFAVSNAVPAVKEAAKHQCNRIADMIDFIMEEK